MATRFSVCTVTLWTINQALHLLRSSALVDSLCSFFCPFFFFYVRSFRSHRLASARWPQGDVSAVITELPLNQAAEILEASVPMEEPVASEPAAAAADNDVWVEVLWSTSSPSFVVVFVCVVSALVESDLTHFLHSHHHRNRRSHHHRVNPQLKHPTSQLSSRRAFLRHQLRSKGMLDIPLRLSRS